MDKNGDRMAVDPESPTASFRDSLDEQPTAPRRNSIEDQDPSRPRKRLATMGSVTPQSDSPTTERGEDMEHSFVDQSAQPNFVQVIEDDIMEQSPESRAPQGSVNTTPVTDQESPASSTTLNKITVNLRPMKSAKGKNIHLTNGIGKAKSLEDVQDVQDVEEVQDEEDDAGIQTSSEATSSPASTQDTSLQSNADVEVEELDDMEEDDISPDEIRIIGGRSPGHILNHQETLNEAKNALNTGPDPRIALIHLEQYLCCRCEDHGEDLELEDLVLHLYVLKQIPNVIEHLLKRSELFDREFCQPREGVGGGIQLIHQLFQTFFRITAMFIRFDAKVLNNSEVGAEVDLLSPLYQEVVADFWAAREPLFVTLFDQFRFDLPVEMTPTVPEFVEEYQGLTAIKDYLCAIYRHLPSSPRLLSQCVAPARVVYHLIDRTYTKKNVHSRIEVDNLQTYTADFTARIVEIFQSTHKAIREALENYPQALPIRDYDSILYSLAQTIHYISFFDAEAGSEMLGQQYSTKLYGLPPNDRAHYAEATFKLPLQCSMIRCNRMDFRIMGMTRLSDSLLRLWKNLGGEGLEPSVALKFVAEDIRESSIVEYLVGPESHPELLRLSATHICGFLIIHDELTPEICEAMWRPLVENKDPRIVQAIIQVMMESLTHMKYAGVVDFCNRAADIPLSSFDGPMLDFVSKLLNWTAKKYYEESRIGIKEKRPRLDPAPYSLITGLIRRASIAQEEPEPSRSVSPTSLFNHMGQELVNITQQGPPVPTREKIYRECVTDIKEHSPSATGSIIVLSSLLQGRQSVIENTNGEVVDDAEALTSSLDLASVLVDELAAFIESNPGHNNTIRTAKLKARLDLLYWVLHRVPDCMTPAQIDRLCVYLVGEKSLGDQERDLAFSKFAALTNPVKPNPFIDYIFKNVLPVLDPNFISPFQLEFCKRWIEIVNSIPAQRDSEVEEGVVFVEGIEEVWRILLTAPSEELAIEAIHYLMRVYFEWSIVTHHKNDIIDATHRKIVERCISQLTSCAAYLKGSERAAGDANTEMAIDLPELEIKGKQTEFIRSIIVLKELLRASRAKPRFALPNGMASSGEGQISGQPIIIRLTWHSSKYRSPVIPLQFGNLDSGDQLHSRITDIIGSPSYRAILNGRELNLQNMPTKTLGELGFLEISSLMVMKRQEDNESSMSTSTVRNFNVIENEVLKHFDELYDLLDLPEPHGMQIWNLLRQFPPQDRVKEVLLSDKTSPSNLIPSGNPFRTQYILYGIQRCLEDSQIQGEVRDAFIFRTIASLLNALTNGSLICNGSIELQLYLYSETVAALLSFLSAPTSRDLPPDVFENDAEFVERMVEIWELSLKPETISYDISGMLAINIFQAILEGISRSDVVWIKFTEMPNVSSLISRMLLQDSRYQVRRHFGMKVLSVYSNAGRASAQGTDVARFFWSMVADLLPQAYNWESQAHELFEVANNLFRYLGNYDFDPLSLEKYFLQWTDRLISHRVVEVVGRPREDAMVSGYSRLLYTWVQITRGRIPCLDIGLRVDSVFRNLLFTPMTECIDGDGDLSERLPCLGLQSRASLYQFLRSLAEDPGVNTKILELLLELLPQDRAVVSEAIWNADRTKWTISSAGRVGMRNLSNTCYLNSLMTQLYMNIQFRSFIMNVPVEDRESQSLLYSMKTLFAKMQNGLMKQADPREFTQAIKDYENNEIDVTVQMDVDEFFNLLFDRLEGQMESIEDKNAFRSYYGGKFVQQVKSKECPHISEREEPFSAIQCDIKGKANLKESLKAYVEGEIMEGDNKYSCTTCNKHVDAVKRACLKEIPDHLIFHLKRFEFDLHTMVRSKINDMFEFPDRIDMRPYTVEYLSDSESSSPDLFELTGVLVHNGTAESGHYYSYIKDRQKRSDQDTPVWFDFNDSEVSAFDPSTIAGLCYGGTDFIGPTKEINQQIAFSKTYSAYMLFYERVNPKVSRSTDSHISRKVPIPKELEIQIFQENEATVRKYCLFDPSHLAFTTNILRQSHAFKIAEPTDENEFVARNALYLALKTYEQIGSRMKDSPEAEELISTIKGFFQSKCIDCCNNFLHWICQPTDSLRLLLLRSSNPRVREHTATMIHYALVQIRKYGGDSYGRIEQNGNDIIDIEGNLHKVVEALLSLWGHLPVLFRNWDEYLALVQNIADLGSMERHLLLRWGVLRKAFILFMPDHLPLDREMKLQHSNLLRWGERIKRPSYTNLLELIHALISHCELVHEPCVDEDTRLPMVNSKFLLSQYEKHCLAHSHKKDTELVNSFLFKQVELNSNPVATEHFIRMILTLEPDPFVNGLVSSFKLALLNGICLDPADEAGPSLAGLFTYCCYSREPNHIKEIIRRVADEVPTIHMRGGREHLDFFRSLWIHGRNANMKPSFIYLRVLENMHLWAPPLLVYWDPAIRIDTENLIFDKVIKLRGEGQDSRRDRIENALMKLPEACFSFVENKYLKSKDLQGSTDDKSFDSLIRILESCPRLDMSEDPDYHARIDALKNALNRLVEELEFGSEDWGGSDIGTDSNNEEADDGSV